MYIAIDIGGTNTRVGASKNGRSFFAIEKFKTPARFEDGINAITKTILRLAKGQTSPCKIAVAVPGPIDPVGGRLLNLPNLPGWNHKDIVRAFFHTLHTKIFLINDAAAAGLGEMISGSGAGYDIIAYLTVSTGVGGALVVRGDINSKKGFSAKGACAFPAEPGNQILVPGGKRAPSGAAGTFEAYAAGPAFYKTYGIRTEDCKDQRIWNKYARTLGHGIINTIALWSPEVVVVGGGVSQVGDRLFKPLNAFVQKNLKIFKPPHIVRAKLGDASGLYGCLSLLN